MIRRVLISKRAEKQLRSVPRHIRKNLLDWVRLVETDGVEAVRRILGFHDEPLRGARAGQRSIRLSRSYRAIYVERNGLACFLSVEEVSKHKY